MRELSYYITAVVHLHLEDYTNAGLTMEETKEIIQSIDDPHLHTPPRCEPSGINRNWDAYVFTTRPADIGWWVERVKNALEERLRAMAKEAA